MKTLLLALKSRLQILACAILAAGIFAFPTTVAFARGGHGGHSAGGHAASHAAIARGGFGHQSIRSSGISHSRFAGNAIRSVRSSSGQRFALRNQRFGTVNQHLVAGHHHGFNHHHHFFYPFAFGYPYGYGYYYNDVCNPYSPYYDPYYCRQLYYRGYYPGY